MKTIAQLRTVYYAQTTIGRLVINNEIFCHTLEDTVRAAGIKVKKHTAIPANYQGYKVGIRYSNKFKRDVLVLYTNKDKVTLEHNGVLFKYIYAHGGNKHEDTEGCVLLGNNNYSNTIQGSGEHELFKLVKGWIDNGEEVRWIVTNAIQIG